jgi:hypothetical protein
VSLLDLFSTKSSSTTSNQSNEENLVETINRNVSGNQGNLATEGSSLSVVQNTNTNINETTTDYGAIAAASTALKGATGLAQNALDTVSAANRDTLASEALITDKALNSVGSAYGQALTAV